MAMRLLLLCACLGSVLANRCADAPLGDKHCSFCQPTRSLEIFKNEDLIATTDQQSIITMERAKVGDTWEWYMRRYDRSAFLAGDRGSPEELTPDIPLGWETGALFVNSNPQYLFLMTIDSFRRLDLTTMTTVSIASFKHSTTAVSIRDDIFAVVDYYAVYNVSTVTKQKTLLCGSTESSGFQDGFGANARLGYRPSIVFSPTLGALFLMDQRKLRRLDLSGNLRTIAPIDGIIGFLNVMAINPRTNMFYVTTNCATYRFFLEYDSSGDAYVDPVVVIGDPDGCDSYQSVAGDYPDARYELIANRFNHDPFEPILFGTNAMSMDNYLIRTGECVDCEGSSCNACEAGSRRSPEFGCIPCEPGR